MKREHEKNTDQYNESSDAVVTNIKHMENIVTTLAKRGFWEEEVKTSGEQTEGTCRADHGRLQTLE